MRSGAFKNFPASGPSDYFDMSQSGGAASSSHRQLCLKACEGHASFPSKPPSLQGFLDLKAVVFSCRRTAEQLDLILRKDNGRGQRKTIPNLFSVDVHLELILPFIVSFISFKQTKVFLALERTRNAGKAIVSQQPNK